MSLGFALQANTVSCFKLFLFPLTVQNSGVPPAPLGLQFDHGQP